MSDNTRRIGELHEKLTALANKRNLAEDPLWAAAWDALAVEHLTRLKATGAGPEQDRIREHLSIAMGVADRVRWLMEGRGENAAQLEAELDRLEGRKLSPVA